MPRHLFTLLLASAVAVALFNPRIAGAAPTKELKRLTVDQVATKLDAKDGKTFIYDNNSKDSWAAAHVPGAKWLDDEKVTAADLPKAKDATLIFYCHNEA